MTARTLKELLACLPDDCLALPLVIDRNGLYVPLQMVMIDPPNNLEGLLPKITLSTHRYGEENPEIICKVTARR